MNTTRRGAMSFNDKLDYLHRAGLIYFVCVRCKEPYNDERTVIGCDGTNYENAILYNVNYCVEDEYYWSTYIILPSRNQFDFIMPHDYINVLNYFRNKNITS